jgi:putative peptidoglycan lipid II flippase
VLSQLPAETAPVVSHHRAESFVQAVGSSVLWRAVDRGASFGKHLIVAAALGLSAQLDSFYMGMAVLGIFVCTWGNLMDVLAVPKLVAYSKAGDQEKFDRTTSGLFTLTILFGICLVAIAFLARPLIHVFAPGFSGRRLELLSGSVVYFLPFVLVYTSFRCLGATFRAVRRFTTFYFADALVSLLAVAVIAFFRNKPYILVISQSLAEVGAFLFLLALASRRFRLIGHPFSPEVRACLRMAPGLLVLQATIFVYQMIERFFVSYLPEGGVGALTYAWTLVATVPALASFGDSFLTVFAERQSTPDRGSGALNDLVAFAIFVGAPATIFFIFESRLLIQAMLQRGRFTPADTYATATTLMAYAAAAIPLFLLPVVDQVFQVIGKVYMMALRLCLGIGTNVVVNAILLFKFHAGRIGIASAFSFSYWMMLLLAIVALNRQGVAIDLRRHARWLAIMLAASSLGVWVINTLFAPLDGIAGLAARLCLYPAFVVSLVLLLPVGEGALLRRLIERVSPVKFSWPASEVKA